MTQRGEQRPDETPAKDEIAADLPVRSPDLRTEYHLREAVRHLSNAQSPARPAPIRPATSPAAGPPVPEVDPRSVYVISALATCMASATIYGLEPGLGAVPSMMLGSAAALLVVLKPLWTPVAALANLWR